MNAVHSQVVDGPAGESVGTGGLRFTPQRRQVYSVLLEKRDHPTANEVYWRAKQALPDISMATVYNCLDVLVQRGLVRQVNLDRGPTRYCPNMEEHCHFYCDDCGGIFDVDYNPEAAQAEIPMPTGFTVTHFEIAIRGVCAACAARQKGRGLPKPRPAPDIQPTEPVPIPVDA